MELTFLNGMAGSDFPLALDRYASLNLEIVDLKDAIWGRAVEDLTDEQAQAANGLLRERSLRVHCLSTALGWADVAMGELAWRRMQESLLDRILRLAETLRPRFVRVLGIRSAGAAVQREQLRWTVNQHPWVPAAYSELFARIQGAGFAACLENEAEHCALATPSDVQAMFGFLGSLPGVARCAYIWDVQNMWQSGTFPSVATFQGLLPHVQMLHLKGGCSDANNCLVRASGLREASWPVVEILSEAYRTGLPGVLCLNPSHGLKLNGYDVWEVAQQDVAFLREKFPWLNRSVSVASL